MSPRGCRIMMMGTLNGGRRLDDDSDRVDGDDAARAPSSPMYQGARLFCSGPHVYTTKSQAELAYIDILANSKIRLNSVKRITQIHNTS